MIRVLVADDHSLVRSGLSQLLATADDIELVGLACDGAEAVALTDQLLPDVVLMDLSMPTMDGIAATRQIALDHPEVRVVALTAFAERSTVLAALDAGAIGYVLKDGAEEELLRATRAAARGESPLSPRAAHVVLTARATRSGPEISDREREVLTLVADGLGNRDIGVHLGISEKTVKAHLTRVYQRLGISNRAQAIDYARQRGFTTPLADRPRAADQGISGE